MSLTVSRLNFRRSLARMAWLGGALAISTSVLLADVATGITKKEKERGRDKDEKRKGPSYLPEGRSLTTGFVAGQSIDIELSAAAGTTRQVEFLIRQAPQNGTLSALRPHPSDSSKVMVTYQHGSVHGPLSDSFTFACRVPDGSWSAPATITLVGQRMEPKIEIVENPSFGKIFTGQEKAGKVVVRNAGSSPLYTDLVWQEPWVGPTSLKVPVGGVEEFLVIFRPTKAGEYRQDMVLQPGVPSSRVILYGDSVLPFSASPSKVELSFKETEGRRVGSISLVNARDEIVQAAVLLPAGLQGPSTVELGPSSKTEMLLWLPEDHVEKFSGEVVIKSGPSTATVVVEAKPTPAFMKLVSPGADGIDFGKVTGKTNPTYDVTVENRGGEALVLEAKTIPPFALDNQGGAISIEPRQRRTFKVSLRADRPGVQTGHVEFLSGTGRITVPLRVDVQESNGQMPLASSSGAAQKAQPAISEVRPAPVPPTHQASPSSQPRTAPAASGVSNGNNTSDSSPGVTEELDARPRGRTETAVLALLAMKGMPMPKDSVNPYLEQPSEVEILGRDSSSITVAWGKPSVMPSGWTIEFASMVYQQEFNTFVKVWKQHPNWKPEEVGSDKVGIRLFGLRPAEQYELRILGVDREGKFSKPSVAVVTATSDAWRVPAWAWRLMIVSALGLVGYVLFRVRRGDFLVEA